MSDFWAGVMSGLVGAVVGGAFTAVGAQIQARAAHRTAQMQIAAANEQLIRTTSMDLTRRAVLEFTDLLEQISNLWFSLSSQHHHARRKHDWSPGDPCPSPPDFPAELDLLCRALNRADAVYGQYIPQQARDALDSVFDKAFINSENWPEFLSKLIESTEDSPGCKLAYEADRLAADTYLKIETLRKASGVPIYTH